MILPSLLFRSAGDTYTFGSLLGSLAEPGDLIALYGDLGAGKTCLTQGIAAGLGIFDEAITSPTYTLINEHLSGRIPLYHMDAYRIRDVDELGPIGFDEYLARGDGLLIIEWANNVESELPDKRLEIHLTQNRERDSRDALPIVFGTRARILLDSVLDDLQRTTLSPTKPT